MKTMETYCVSYKKKTTNRHSNVRRNKQSRLMLLSKFTICSKKKNQGSLKIKNQVNYGTN